MTQKRPTPSTITSEEAEYSATAEIAIFIESILTDS